MKKEEFVPRFEADEQFAAKLLVIAEMLDSDSWLSTGLETLVGLAQFHQVEKLAANPYYLRVAFEDPIQDFCFAVERGAEIKKRFPPLLDDYEDWAKENCFDFESGPQVGGPAQD